jgi:ABC-type phosphate transport system permease subunit
MELAMQEAAHVLALGHAVGDTLAVEFVDELF